MTASDGVLGRTGLHRFIIFGGSTDTTLVLGGRMNPDLDVRRGLMNAECNDSILSKSGCTFSMGELSVRIASKVPNVSHTGELTSIY